MFRGERVSFTFSLFHCSLRDLLLVTVIMNIIGYRTHTNTYTVTCELNQSQCFVAHTEMPACFLLSSVL